MTREIKFRIWDDHLAEWISSKEIFVRGDGVVFADIGKEIIEIARFEDMTINQFTGLKDKNGKEIYEGDIIKSFDETGKVFFNTITGSWDFEHLGGDCDLLFIQYEENNYEIIGNIYEK